MNHSWGQTLDRHSVANFALDRHSVANFALGDARAIIVEGLDGPLPEYSNFVGRLWLGPTKFYLAFS